MSSKQNIKTKYQSGAKYYDLYIWLYHLIGFRIKAYRSRAVKLLDLQQGDCVVELGCGTGLNFPFILEKIGPEGRLLGVDLTPGMLACARDRVERAGWQNVELVQSDLCEYDFPEGVNKTLATGVFGFVDEYDRVIEKVSHSLVMGGQMVIMDVKQPGHWPSWLVNLFVYTGKSFGLSLKYLDHRPWESIERHFEWTDFEVMYSDIMYISSGTTLLNGT